MGLGDQREHREQGDQGIRSGSGFPNLQRGAASRGSRIYTEEQGK